MWKRTLFILSFFALLFVALFPLELFLKTVEWKTRGEFKKRFGADFTFEDLAWHNGKVRFIHGKISKAGTFEASFEEATFSPYVHLFKREIGGTLKIHHPKLLHQKEGSLSLLSKKKKFFPFLTFNLKMIVNDGLLFLESFNEPIGLNLKQEMLGKKMVGRLILDWQEKPFETFFSLEGEEMEVAACFREHDFPKVSQVMTYFFGEKIPTHFKEWKILDGRIDGKVTAQLSKGKPSYLEGSLHLWDVKASNDPLSICGLFNTCDALFDINPQKAGQWNGEFSLQGGNVALKEEYLSGIWDIDSLSSMICVKEGQVESSFLQGSFLGMEGEIDFDWLSKETLMQLKFTGSSKEVVPLIPEKFQPQFSLSFPDDHLELEATLSHHLNGLELDGKLHFNEEDVLNFGCQFGGGVDKSFELPEGDLLEQLKSQFCLSKKRLGWFEASQLPLEKYFTPFFFGDVPVELSGVVNVKGNFDERYLVMFYDGEKVNFETSSFALTVDEISNSLHYIDLMTGDHIGYLPLKNGKHVQKNYGLTFDHVDTSVQFENQMIHLKEIETNWKGLPFTGKIDIHLESLTDFDLEMAGEMKQGSLMVGRELLSHFNTSFLSNLPLLGTFSSDGFSFKFHNGTLVDGTLGGKCYFEMDPLYDTTATFDYNLLQHRFTLKESCGHLHVKGFPLDFKLPTLSFDREKIEGELLLFSTDRTLLDVKGSFDRLKEEILITGEDVLIKGFGEEGHYYFPKITCGNWIADIQTKNRSDSIEIEELKVTHPEKGELYFSGLYNKEQKRLRGEVEKLEIELSPLISRSLWSPKGHLSASGELDWTMEEVKGNLLASSTDLEFGSIPFKEGRDLKFSFSSAEGLTVEGLELLGEYRLEKLHYDFDYQKLVLDNFDFTLLPDRLPKVAELAKSLFPGKIHDSFFEAIKELKEEDLLEGKLMVEVYPQNLFFSLHLKDGLYHFLDQSWDLKNFTLSYDPMELNLKTETSCCGKECAIHLKTDSLTLMEGELSITDEKDTLTALWQRFPNHEWTIKQIEGAFFGFAANLVNENPDGSDLLEMKGSVEVDPQFLPQLGGVYLLTGNFDLLKSDLANSTFYGSIKGSHCTYESVEVESLIGECYLSQALFELRDLCIDDWSGRLFLDRAVFFKQEDWQFHLSHLALQDFRLSRLTSRWTTRERGKRPLYRSFFIPTFELNDFSGTLSNHLSYQGGGELHFTNYPRKTLFSHLMLVPTEISARIGLDLTNLIPARGTIVYTIEEGKIHLNDFQDVFSDGKHSRFYLAENSPATIGFDGEMNISIKMKQYNLLLKLAELFTISVKGSVFQPSYVFTNSSELVKAPG
ncbi:MAG: hypothetical protein S4CHLAM45_04760 [Chlamydiales bacterium]|nr:hypothetical protein [Chlamydiales bacterium]MCH9619983.1 hypothetical protein [Chlamydiales bacterium]MCH9622590.1 hypothetical protein [Chlamydiales bacterium]